MNHMNHHKLFAQFSLLIAVVLSGSVGFGSSRQDRKPIELPFQITNNLIILRGGINGSKPLSLLLDTGAGGSVINESRAKELGLKLKRQGAAATGDGPVESSFVKGVELNVSGVKLSDLTLTAIDLRGLEAGFGQPIDGILGYDIFARFVVEIDYTEINSQNAPSNYGILAGKSNAQIGRIQDLQLGRFVIKNPITTFAPDNRGEEDTTDYAGLVGGEILRRFRVIVDYSRKQVILEPNRNFSEPYEFDMSGASLTSGGSDFKIFKVRALVEKSPAAEAGLRVGDEIIAIDGKPTTGMTLERIRQMFRQARRKYVVSKKGDWQRPPTLGEPPD